MIDDDKGDDLDDQAKGMVENVINDVNIENIEDLRSKSLRDLIHKISNDLYKSSRKSIKSIDDLSEDHYK